MTVDTNYLNSQYAEAAGYLGNRRALRKEVEMHPDRISVLEAQTDLMSQVSLHKGMLWSVELKTTGAKIHLFAVIHVSLQSKVDVGRFIHGRVIKELLSSKCLYVEIQDQDMLSDGLLVRYLVQKLESYKSLYLSEFTHLQSKRFTCLGLDRVLSLFAIYNNIEVRSLELVDTQLNCIRELINIREKQANLSSSGIEERKYLDGEVTLDCLDAIQAGNFEQICDTFRDLPELNAPLQKRNPKMVSQMIRVLEASSPAFFAIGGWHFPGKEGILALLSKDERLRISRIQLP